ncbi:Rhs family protein [Lysobacter enzymogenes]|uniref:Rhs family protein n=1 Tax=Lysobacter enzymogenes TaxID=69 RepID=A0A0S2DD89_LYSEN|nr:RHS repeat-associated core domain-containing protein [Lysobacter enzymogenes]ALN56523.1 Rhs family protein [Lysobacter enzymogenes]QCW25338.1 RHS repeat protein [Lysobacter enzymogenes]
MQTIGNVVRLAFVLLLLCGAVYSPSAQAASVCGRPTKWDVDYARDTYPTEAQALAACYAVPKTIVNDSFSSGREYFYDFVGCIRVDVHTEPELGRYRAEYKLRSVYNGRGIVTTDCSAMHPVENHKPSDTESVTRFRFRKYLPDKAKNLGEACADQCFGDPINAGTGNKFESRTEFMGEGVFPLQVRWVYNSFGTAPGSDNRLTFGRNRAHHYLRSIVLSSFAEGSVAWVVHPDGRTISFYRQQDDVWAADSPGIGTLERVPLAAGALGWRYKAMDGSIEDYGENGELRTLTSPQGFKQAVEYDSAGRLATVTDPNARKLMFEYQGAGRQVSVIRLPDGQSLGFSYTQNGDLERVTYPGGASIVYAYDEPAHMQVPASGGALTGVYDENGQRYSTTDYIDGNIAVRTALGGGVDVQTGSYTSTGDIQTPRRAVVTTGLGATINKVFTVKNGRTLLASVSKSCSGCVSSQQVYTYDAFGQQDRITHNGVTTDYDYNARGLLTKRTDDADGAAGVRRSTETDWDPLRPLALQQRILDGNGAVVGVRNWTYNERGQALAIGQTDPATGDSRLSTTRYCEQADIDSGLCPVLGLLVEQDGARTDTADTTRYSYYMADAAGCAVSSDLCGYRRGDLWKIVNAAGHTQEILRYDGAGRVLSSKDANGVVVDLEYTGRGWLAARKMRGPDANSETDDAITRYEYDLAGQVKKVIQPDGSYVRYEYDAAHRLTDIFDMADNRIHYTLDAAGNRIKEDTKDAGGALKRTLSRIYNQLGQLQTAKTAEGHPTGYTYDADGNGDVVTDALGRKTDSDYDPLGRLAKTLQDVGGINAKTEFKYDAQDRLVRVTDPKNLNTDYGYNGFGDQVRLSSPDTGVSTFTYDSAGNRKTATDARGITQTYSYDALNRVTGVGYPTSSLDVAYTYDSVPAVCAVGETFTKGRLTLMTDGSGSTQYCYDRFGNTTRKVQTTNGKVFTVRYGYTLAGQLSSLTYPDGALVSYRRDPQGRITQIDAKRGTPGAVAEVLLRQATYHPFGAVAGWTYGNGRTMFRSADLDYRTVAVSDPSPGGLSVGFGFDAVGNVEKLTPAGATNALLVYSYDALNRFTGLRDGPTGASIESYTYDAAGNRTSFTNAAGGQIYTYALDSHRLIQAGSASTRGYDANGNSTQIDGKSFSYNDAGRNNELKLGSVPLRAYVYNGRGEQVRKYSGSDDRYTVYDEAGHWLGEYDFNGVVVQQAIWMEAAPVGLWTGAVVQQALHYVEVDHLATPRVVIDPVRDLAVWAWDLKGEVFGAGSPNEDTDGDGVMFSFNMRFAGQQYDATSGLNYNYNRDYEPGTGRYTQVDPLLHSQPRSWGAAKPYSYAELQPFRYNDPLGLFSWDPSCMNDCNAGGINQDWRSQIDREARTLCQGLSNFVTNVRRAKCISKSCEDAVVSCGECPARRNPTDGSSSVGAAESKVGFWGVRFNTPKICTNAAMHKTTHKPGFGGVILIHELAHGCGWDDKGGEGVPDPWSASYEEEALRLGF